jgi:hypothetical protein
MKQTSLGKMLAIGAVSVVALSTAFAQTTTKETTTSTTAGTTGVSASTTTSTLDGTGMISAYAPGTDYVTVKTETGAPTKYYYSKTTTLVDPSGAAVEWSMLKPDMPVKYTYVKQGDRMVISKITVQKPVSEITKETTTTTTTSH